MKKTILIGLLAFSTISSVVFGQKGKVNTAYTLATMSPADYKAAKENIDAALADPSTPNDLNTWYKAAVVYDKLVDEQKINVSLTGSDDKEARGTSALKAYDFFIKAYNFDIQPDEKGRVKPKYEKNIVSTMKTYPVELFAYGASKFDERKYTEAVAIWEKYLDMPNLPFLKQEGLEKDSLYATTAYYTAVAAMSNQDENQIDKAIKYYEMVKGGKLAAKNDYINDAYVSLTQLYLNDKKDTVNYLRTVKEGFKKYPENSFFLNRLTNYYLNMRLDVDSAFYYVDQTIKQNPQAADNYYIRGAIYEEGKKDINAALQDYKKALELNPKQENALYALGNYYRKLGETHWSNANNTRDANISKKEKAKATELFTEALKYLEQVRTLNSKQRNNLLDLRAIYYKIYGESSAKYLDVDKAIKAL